MEDRKALNILLNAYWSSSGWKDGKMSPEDYLFAKEKGYVFDSSLIMSHDELIHEIKKQLSYITLHSVSNAFLYSLSTRKLEYRSALGSFVIARSLPIHRFTESYFNRICGVCGEYESVDINRNVLNFERYKWGGVRHLHLEYMLFDLEQFRKLEPVVPSKEDNDIFSGVIRKVMDLNSSSGIRDLEKSLSKVLKSNKAEREVLLQILCFCGILENPEYSGFSSKYTNFIDRPDAVAHKNDWSFPSYLWKAEHRINIQALKEFFPDYS
jgi:hypothetical protein